jgi:hypothetical protein
MTETTSQDRLHPILGCACEVAAAVAKVARTCPAFMTREEKRGALLQLARDEAMLSELRLRVLAAAEIDEVGADSGASSTAGWVAHATKQTRPSAGADVRIAMLLDGEFELTRDALADGRLHLAQARVIIAAIQKLSERVTAEQCREAEAHLIVQAKDFDALALAVLGRRLFEVLDPERADEEEGRALEEEEARARANASFSIRANGDGTHSGSFKVPDLHAAILKKALQALTSPRRIGEARRDADGKKIPYPNLLGQGFMELLEHLPADGLPTAAGAGATIVVTLSHASLLSGLGAASLDDGTRISASEARRLACEGSLIPMVLGGDSQPLDVGRSRRLHTRYQRVVLANRDGGCLAENCDRPPSWCEAHHEVWWERGGDTSVDNGSLRCAYHHRLEHDDRYDKTKLPGGAVRYRRRQ